MKNTIAIIGAGRVGSTTAYSLIVKNLVSELLIVDVNQERCEGEVRDLADTLGFSETAHVRQAECSDACNADIIIITAGYAQQPDQPRSDLFEKNGAVIQCIMDSLGTCNPEAIILVVTNPVDLMTALVQKYCKLPKNQILGSGTWLDTQRLRRYIGQELALAPESVDAYIIGEHGDTQCVAWKQANISGTPLTTLIPSRGKREELAHKTATEAYTIIEKKCATFYGIAACVTDICEAIIFDQKKIVPVSSFIPSLGACLSMPVVLGKKGVERHIMLELDDAEKECLFASAKKIDWLSSESKK